jgi:5-formyltetrahydrofolate cyclo-ligase
VPTQAQIRRSARSARRSLGESERAHADACIAGKVMRANWFWHAKTVGCYLSMAEEVDTSAIILRAWRMKKRVFVPVIEKNSSLGFRRLKPETSLIRDTLGILSPRDGATIKPGDLDIMLTPLVAFDDSKHRVGMGGGFFDRSFAELRYRSLYVRPKLIGLAYASQKVEEISPNPWDIRLFDVITESG